MRFLIPAAALMLLAAQVQAQTTTSPGTGPAAGGGAPGAGNAAAAAPGATSKSTTAPAAASAPTTASPGSGSSTGVPDTAMPAAPMHKGSSRRMSLQQHFDKVNASHDGHITKDEATAGKWGYVSQHFDAMDKDHKGYVTMDDIHAYSKSSHGSRHHSHKPTASPQPASETNG